MINTKKRILIIMLMAIILMASVTMQTQEVYAFAPAIPIIYAGTAVLATLLIASGFEGLTEDDVNDAWELVPLNLKNALTEVGLHGIYQGFGMGSFILTSAIGDMYYDWFSENAIDGSFEVSNIPLAIACYQPLTDITSLIEYNELMATYQYVLMASYVYNNVIEDSFIYATNSKPEIYSTNETMYMKLTGTTIHSQRNIANSRWNKYRWTYYSGTYQLGQITLSNGAGWKINAVSVPIEYHNNAGEYLVPFQTGSTLTWEQMWNPTIKPLPSISADGTIGLSSPTTTNPDTNAEVPVPYTNVDTNTVLDGIGAIDGYTDSEGSLVTGDGTVIDANTDTAEIPRTDGWDDVTDVPTDTTGVSDIPILGDIVKWLTRIYERIGELFTPYDFTWSEPLQPFIDSIIDKTGLDQLAPTMDRFTNIPSGYGSPPQIYINLHDLTNVAQNVGSFNNTMPSQNTLVIDFTMLQDSDVKFLNLTLIEIIRMFLTIGMVLTTVMHIYRKIIPDKAISGGN